MHLGLLIHFGMMGRICDTVVGYCYQELLGLHISAAGLKMSQGMSNVAV
jgi:hypothetical protein